MLKKVLLGIGGLVVLLIVGMVVVVALFADDVLFADADKDENDLVSVEELVDFEEGNAEVTKAAEAANQSRAEYLGTLFDRFDADSNGGLDEDEFKKYNGG